MSCITSCYYIYSIFLNNKDVINISTNLNKHTPKYNFYEHKMKYLLRVF